MMRGTARAIVALAIFFLAPTTWGQNLVINPDFATDVGDWSVYATSAIDWNSLDSEGSLASGSGLVTNMSTTALDATGARQCVEGLTGGSFYRFVADILVPSGQTETGKAYLLVQWYAGAKCDGGGLGLIWTPYIQSFTPDAWYTEPGYSKAPTAALSARLTLSVRKTEDFGTLQAHFDNVVFEEMIFGDDFESGDLTAWSQTVP
jgi:hypothetical protein